MYIDLYLRCSDSCLVRFSDHQSNQISLKEIMKLSWVYSISHPVEPSRLESPKPSELSRCQGIIRWKKRAWWDPSGFIKSVLDVCPCWSPQCFSPALSTEVSLSPSGEGNFSHHRPLLAARPGGQIIRDRRLTFGQ